MRGKKPCYNSNNTQTNQIWEYMKKQLQTLTIPPPTIEKKGGRKKIE
jgi:hypothetical protein